MPPYPSYKFFTETKWESETDGGYIGVVYVPITRDVDGWSITFKFSMPITKLENWEFSPRVQARDENFWQNYWQILDIILTNFWTTIFETIFEKKFSGIFDRILTNFWRISDKFLPNFTKCSILVQTPSDGVTCSLHNDHWNGVRVEGTEMRMRLMVEFKRTPGMPPGLIPQPAVAILGTIWYPDGSHTNYDEGFQRNAVSYSEGFSGS